MRLIWALLAIYTLGWLIWQPPGIGIRDETAYVAQAVAFSQGNATVHRVDALTGKERVHAAASKPPGVSLMMAPFVRLFGLRGAFVLSVLALWIAVLCSASLLKGLGYDPLWSTLILAYIPVLVLGRTAMSDLPATAWTALSLLAFFQWAPKSWRWAVLAGFIIGSNLVIRETNVLLMLPLCMGAVFRRDRHLWALILGGLLGCGLRLLLFSLVFGSMWGFQKEGLIYGFSLAAFMQNLPLYLFALMAMVPGGLVYPVLYRGPRRIEMGVTVFIFVAFYALYGYSGAETAGLQRLVVAPRFFAPLIPLLALCAAESGPRVFRAWCSKRSWSDSKTKRLSFLGRWFWIAGLSSAAIAVHPVHHDWTQRRAEISNLIERKVPQDACMILSSGLEKKYVQELYGPRKWVPGIRADAVLRMLPLMAPQCTQRYLLILNRTDSTYWRDIAIRNKRMLTQLMQSCSLVPVLDHVGSRNLHMRIWRIKECEGPES